MTKFTAKIELNDYQVQWIIDHWLAEGGALPMGTPKKHQAGPDTDTYPGMAPAPTSTKRKTRMVVYPLLVELIMTWNVIGVSNTRTKTPEYLAEVFSKTKPGCTAKDVKKSIQDGIRRDRLPGTWNRKAGTWSVTPTEIGVFISSKKGEKKKEGLSGG